MEIASLSMPSSINAACCHSPLKQEHVAGRYAVTVHLDLHGPHPAFSHLAKGLPGPTRQRGLVPIEAHLIRAAWSGRETALSKPAPDPPQRGQFFLELFCPATCAPEAQSPLPQGGDVVLKRFADGPSRVASISGPARHRVPIGLQDLPIATGSAQEHALVLPS